MSTPTRRRNFPGCRYKSSSSSPARALNPVQIGLVPAPMWIIDVRHVHGVRGGKERLLGLVGWPGAPLLEDEDVAAVAGQAGQVPPRAAGQPACLATGVPGDLRRFVGQDRTGAVAVGPDPIAG